MKAIYILAFSLIPLGFAPSAPNATCEIEKRHLQEQLNKVLNHLQNAMRDVQNAAQQEAKDNEKLSSDIDKLLQSQTETAAM